MADNTVSRRLRGAFRNSLVWGTAWGSLGTAVATVMRLGDKIPLFNAVLDGIGMGVRIGIGGAVAGAVFSTIVSVVYGGKKLSEISWVKFGLGGMVLAGMFVPGFLQTMHLLSDGSLMPFHLISDDMVYSALFGGITAAGTMKLAQIDEKKNPLTVQELLDRMETDSLAAGDATSYATSQRERAAVESIE